MSVLIVLLFVKKDFSGPQTLVWQISASTSSDLSQVNHCNPTLVWPTYYVYIQVLVCLAATMQCLIQHACTSDDITLQPTLTVLTDVWLTLLYSESKDWISMGPLQWAFCEQRLGYAILECLIGLSASRHTIRTK